MPEKLSPRARSMSAVRIVLSSVLSCNEQCTPAYLDCSKLQEAQPQEFTSVDGALSWLKRNRHSVLVGSVVVAAGVAFVVVSAGAGAVLLVPAVLLASPSSQPGPSMAGVAP